MNRSLIFDIGCHNGDDANFYLRKGFRVVGVEANPELCAALRRRFANEIKDGSFILVERAIAEYTGDIEFFTFPEIDIWGSIRSEWAERNIKGGVHPLKIVVPSITFPSLIEKYGVPYYLKIDIEGADFLCVEGLSQFKERPIYLSIEIEHNSLLKRELKLLKQLGYSSFKIVDQKSVPQQQLPYPPLEGAYVDSRPTLGATGVFGRELPGSWLTSFGVVTRLFQIMAKNKLLGLSKKIPALSALVLSDCGSWYDLHATNPQGRSAAEKLRTDSS